jgi:hypothetical protein
MKLADVQNKRNRKKSWMRNKYWCIVVKGKKVVLEGEREAVGANMGLGPIQYIDGPLVSTMK